jgi:hypothetical protein
MTGFLMPLLSWLLVPILWLPCQPCQVPLTIVPVFIVLLMLVLTTLSFLLTQHGPLVRPLVRPLLSLLTLGPTLLVLLLADGMPPSAAPLEGCYSLLAGRGGFGAGGGSLLEPGLAPPLEGWWGPLGGLLHVTLEGSPP